MLVFAATVPPLHAATKYAVKTGSDRNDGASLDSAYLTIAKGLFGAHEFGASSDLRASATPASTP